MPKTKNKIHETIEIYHHLNDYEKTLVYWYTRWRQLVDVSERSARWFVRVANRFQAYYPERRKFIIRLFGIRIIVWMSLVAPAPGQID